MAFTTPPQALPPPAPASVSAGLTLLTPQSRRGTGPGLLVVVDAAAAGARIENGIPSPLMKWAEEGYTVVEITADAVSDDLLTRALDALSKEQKCEGCDGKVGLVCYSSSAWTKVMKALQTQKGGTLVGAVVYANAASFADSDDARVPVLAHLAGASTLVPKVAGSKIYAYPEQASSAFATPFDPAFQYAAEAVTHTRNLTFLKKLMDGPFFDLERIWDEHTYYEFEQRDVTATMNTMVAEPYVNHIPTLTGGIGRAALTDFYTNHFVFSNPEGTALELISRTVGIDRVVDEFIFKLNHNREVPWLLPGVPPTGRDLAIPFMAVVNIRGDRLYHEHISWDQATALRQAGLLPETVSWQGQTIKLPVAGTEAVDKMRDKNSVESNVMMKW